MIQVVTLWYWHIILWASKQMNTARRISFLTTNSACIILNLSPIINLNPLNIFFTLLSQLCSDWHSVLNLNLVSAIQSRHLNSANPKLHWTNTGLSQSPVLFLLTRSHYHIRHSVTTDTLNPNSSSAKKIQVKPVD